MSNVNGAKLESYSKRHGHRGSLMQHGNKTDLHRSTLLELVRGYLDTIGFDRTSRTLRREARKSGLALPDKPGTISNPQFLGDLWEEIRAENTQPQENSDSDSDGDDTASIVSSAPSIPVAKSKSLKRKAETESEDSEDTSSDEEEKVVVSVKRVKVQGEKAQVADALKKAKDTKASTIVDKVKPASSKVKTIKVKSTAKPAATAETSSSDSSSEDSSDDSGSDISASSEDESSSDSGSGSGSSDNSSTSSASASKSDSDESAASSKTSDTSDSSSDSDTPPPTTRKAQKSSATVTTTTKKSKKTEATNGLPSKTAKTNPTSTIAATTPITVDNAAEDPDAGMHPDRKRNLPSSPQTDGQPTADVSNKRQKVRNAPFSRIPADQHVDARFASNAYVPYDYAEGAHAKLIVTKGKGFTKEKNKGKPFAYA